MTITMVVNIRAWILLLLMMLSRNQSLYSSQAATTPSGFPFKFMTMDAERAAARKYDYIVIGGGTTGCPLDATLSTKYSVLVVERGGSPYANPDIENADAFGKVVSCMNYSRGSLRHELLSMVSRKIKKIMKADEDVRMISAELPMIFAKDCEMFILELSLRSWIHTEE